MIPIKQLLDKITWDPREKAEDYALAYLDRVDNRLIEVRLSGVKIEKNYLILKNKEIPLHRIKVVKKNDIIIWKRAF